MYLTLSAYAVVLVESVYDDKQSVNISPVRKKQSCLFDTVNARLHDSHRISLNGSNIIFYAYSNFYFLHTSVSFLAFKLVAKWQNAQNAVNALQKLLCLLVYLLACRWRSS